MEEDKPDKPQEFQIGHLTFTAGGSLKLHSTDRTVDKPFRCRICEAEFVLSSHLSMHERTHAPKKLYECNICHGKFSRKGNLKLHMKLHSVKVEYHCKICRAKFPHRKSLKGHKVQHAVYKPYKCWVCPNRFESGAQLVAHLKQHTRNGPYECKVCTAKFVLKYALDAHQKVHGGASAVPGTSKAASPASSSHDPYARRETFQSCSMKSLKKLLKASPASSKKYGAGSSSAPDVDQALSPEESPPSSLEHECAMCSEGFSSLESLYIHKDMPIEIPLELKDLSLETR